MCIAVLFVIAKIWKQPRYPLPNAWFKKIVVYPYYGIQLSNKKQQIIDIGNTLDESPENYALWKKIPKCYILYDFIYIILLKL